MLVKGLCLMKSDNIKAGIARTPHRGLLMATGVSRKNMKAPFIGIASSFSDLVPGHIGMRDLERQIEKGIHSGGGQAFIFGVPAICDGIAMGHSGMRYSLPSRDLIADCVESVAAAHQLDGIVLLSNCDKITPGMLIGALRLNIPAIIVTAGPMLDGECGNHHKLTMVTGSFEAVGKYRNGEIPEEELLALEEASCPSAGACQGMYTANTMACLTEVMGMSLPYCASASAVSSQKRRLAFESGMQIVELVKQDIKPSDIITRESLRNAIVADLALGGSTNTFLHILVIANAGGIDITLNDFEELSGKIHQIVKINPSSTLTMADFHNAGGVPALMQSIGEHCEQKDEDKQFYGKVYRNKEIIPDYDKSTYTQAGLAVLYGNLAKDGCVIKTSGVAPECYTFEGDTRHKARRHKLQIRPSLAIKDHRRGEPVHTRRQGYGNSRCVGQRKDNARETDAGLLSRGGGTDNRRRHRPGKDRPRLVETLEIITQIFNTFHVILFKYKHTSPSP